MKKIIVVSIIIAIMLSACSNTIKPIKVKETEFDLSEAEIILKKAWKPVNEITNSKFETRPNIPIKSSNEFFNIYDFSYMEEQRLRVHIFEVIVDLDNNGKVVTDNNGNLVFGEGNIINYIPTIYDKGVSIKRAYIKETKYKEEYSSLDKIELVIEEESNSKIIDIASEFHRKNYFRRNEHGEWILYDIEGTTAIGWER
ncbi:hypothetical protein [Cellulosilyticum sp. I15G10I2]|uniref:hypothetical protein n=1 Tax=Cellulosilyticum sp. I15G10I2 TaxID=1892843 RepID=UPI00114C8E71|nr:hypothetical protein [Cellulosilyticum sp. I15G10I2]